MWLVTDLPVPALLMTDVLKPYAIFLNRFFLVSVSERLLSTELIRKKYRKPAIMCYYISAVLFRAGFLSWLPMAGESWN